MKRTDPGEIDPRTHRRHLLDVRCTVLDRRRSEPDVALFAHDPVQHGVRAQAEERKIEPRVFGKKRDESGPPGESCAREARIAGLEIVGGTSQQFASLIVKEAAKWADVAKKAGIKAE